MKTVNATDLKNRLGQILAAAVIERVAIKRHGQVVAYLVPAERKENIPTEPSAVRPTRTRGMTRGDEERIAGLVARRDFRPSRWERAGDPYLMAGVAVMLASHADFDRPRMLALAERLYPGISSTKEFSRWLKQSKVQAARLLPQLAMARQGRGASDAPSATRP
jgi:antitoxin (DNA-binding transcriptional repressor) of toxin-antitoxin stability system